MLHCLALLNTCAGAQSAGLGLACPVCTHMCKAHQLPDDFASHPTHRDSGVEPGVSPTYKRIIPTQGRADTLFNLDPEWKKGSLATPHPPPLCPPLCNAPWASSQTPWWRDPPRTCAQAPAEAGGPQLSPEGLGGQLGPRKPGGQGR